MWIPELYIEHTYLGVIQGVGKGFGRCVVNCHMIFMLYL